MLLNVVGYSRENREELGKRPMGAYDGLVFITVKSYLPLNYTLYIVVHPFENTSASCTYIVEKIFKLSIE